MSAPILGFVGALILAALVVLWITYCMFCREKHKSEANQYTISDLKYKNIEIAQELDAETSPPKKEISVGFIVLPSRRKQKDSVAESNQWYDKRPDYPESVAPFVQLEADMLEEIVHDVVDDTDRHYVDGIIDTPSQYSQSESQYHSDV